MRCLSHHENQVRSVSAENGFCDVITSKKNALRRVTSTLLLLGNINSLSTFSKLNIDNLNITSTSLLKMFEENPIYVLDMAHCLPVDASSTLSNLSITLCSPNFDDFKRACVLLTQQEMFHVDPPAQATTEVPALREVFPL